MGSQRYESGNLKKHPHIASFIASVAVEPTPELKSAIFSEANEKYIASLVLHERDYKNSDTRRMQN